MKERGAKSLLPPESEFAKCGEAATVAELTHPEATVKPPSCNIGAGVARAFLNLFKLGPDVPFPIFRGGLDAVGLRIELAADIVDSGLVLLILPARREVGTIRGPVVFLPLAIINSLEVWNSRIVSLLADHHKRQTEMAKIMAFLAGPRTVESHLCKYQTQRQPNTTLLLTITISLFIILVHPIRH